MIVRIIGLILTGVILFAVLIHIAGWKNNLKLRKRTDKNHMQNSRIPARKIIILYILSLTCFIVLGFLAIKFWIRGEV